MGYAASDPFASLMCYFPWDEMRFSPTIKVCRFVLVLSVRLPLSPRLQYCTSKDLASINQNGRGLWYTHGTIGPLWIYFLIMKGSHGNRIDFG